MPINNNRDCGDSVWLLDSEMVVKWSAILLPPRLNLHIKAMNALRKPKFRSSIS